MSVDPCKINKSDKQLPSQKQNENAEVFTNSNTKEMLDKKKGILTKTLESLPKVIIQGIIALIIAAIGAKLGFWGNISSENYSQRVEAVSNLAGYGTEFSQIARSFFNARINAHHYIAAVNRFGKQKSIERAQYWYRRSADLLVELGRCKGRFRRSLTTVRLLFPDNKVLLDEVLTTEATQVMNPEDKTDSSKVFEDLEKIRKEEMKAAGDRINNKLVPAINNLVNKLVEELAQRPHGKK